MASCLTCTGSSTNCTACGSGLFLMGSACVSTCPAGTFIAGATCADCDVSCATCSGSSTTCLSCPTDLLLYASSCASSCPDGSFDDGDGVCALCDASCAACNGTSTECTSCPSGQYLASSNNCVASCPDGTYADASSGDCLSCDASCLACSSASTCSTCPSASYLSNSGLCDLCGSTCTACDNVNYLANATAPDVVSCTACTSPLLVSNGNCVPTCPNGTFVAVTSCSACPVGCTACVSYKSCTSCSAGYSLSMGTCIALQCAPVSGDGNANWTQTATNTNATGTCLAGYVGSPTRTCSSSATFGPVVNPCLPIVTAPVTTSSSCNGTVLAASLTSANSTNSIVLTLTTSIASCFVLGKPAKISWSTAAPLPGNASLANVTSSTLSINKGLLPPGSYTFVANVTATSTAGVVQSASASTTITVSPLPPVALFVNNVAQTAAAYDQTLNVNGEAQ